jgi:hypothetical protein
MFGTVELHAEFEIGNQGDLPINLKKFGCETVDWTHLAQDESQWQAVMNMVMKCGECIE